MKGWFSCACYETDEEFDKMKGNLEGQVVEVANNDEMSKFLGWLLIRIWSLYGLTANNITAYKEASETDLSALLHDPQWALLQQFINKNLREMKDDPPTPDTPLSIFVGPDMNRLVDFLTEHNVELLNGKVLVKKDHQVSKNGSDMRAEKFHSMKERVTYENQKPK